MAIAGYSKFNSYKNLMYSLKDLEDDTLKSESFLLDKDEKKQIEIYYAPFEHVNEKAKVVIVGITPGLFQMKQAFSTVHRVKDYLSDNEKILHEVKKNSSFQGPMRKNLIAMLDELQLPQFLGISSTSELFDTANHLVHTTSAITYPVFYKGKNYSGSTPHILKTKLLKQYIVQNFATELSILDNPLIIPLGVNVTKVLDFLVVNHYIDSQAILYGFPHTSGGNGHRHKQFAENKVQMSQKIKNFFK